MSIKQNLSRSGTFSHLPPDLLMTSQGAFAAGESRSACFHAVDFPNGNVSGKIRSACPLSADLLNENCDRSSLFWDECKSSLDYCHFFCFVFSDRSCNPKQIPQKTVGLLVCGILFLCDAVLMIDIYYTPLWLCRGFSSVPHLVCFCLCSVSVNCPKWRCISFVVCVCSAQVGDFADANSWPTPGEIATKDMQVGVCARRRV